MDAKDSETQELLCDIDNDIAELIALDNRMKN